MENIILPKAFLSLWRLDIYRVVKEGLVLLKGTYYFLVTWAQLRAQVQL
jgi:hypothetical protein